MLILACYRITIGNTTVQADTYIRLSRLDPQNIEEARENLRAQVIQKYRQRKRGGLGGKAEKSGKLHFTSLVEIEDGPIPVKNKTSQKDALPDIQDPDNLPQGNNPTAEETDKTGKTKAHMDDAENQFRSRRTLNDNRRPTKSPGNDSQKNEPSM